MSGSHPTRRGLLHAGVASGGLLAGVVAAKAAVPGRGMPVPADPSLSLAAAQMPQAAAKRIREEFGHRLDLRAFIPAGVTDTTAVDCSPWIAQALAALEGGRGRLDIGGQFYLVASPILTGDYSVFIHGDGADISGFIGTSTDAVIAHRPAADNLLGSLFGEDFSVRCAASTPTRFGIDVKYPVDATIVTDAEGNRGFARDGASSPTGKSASDSTQQSKPGVMLRRVKVLSNQDGSSPAASFRTALRLYGATVCLIDDFLATANPGGVADSYGIELGGYTRAVRIESPDLENFHIAVAPTSYWEGITVNRPQSTNVDHFWRSPNAGTKDYVPLGIKGGSGDEVNITNAGEIVCLDTAIHVHQAFRTFISGCHLETDWRGKDIRPGAGPRPVVIIEDCEETRLLDCFVVQGDPVQGRTSIAVHVTGQAGGGNQVHVHDVACRAGWIEFDDKTYFCNSSGCTALIGDGPRNDSMPAVVDRGTGNVVSYDMPRSVAPGRQVVNNLEVSGTLSGAGGQVFVPSALVQLAGGGGFVTTAGRAVPLPFSEALANPGKAYDLASRLYTAPEAGTYEFHLDVDTAEGTPPVSQVGLGVGRTTKWGNSGVHRTTIAATIHARLEAGARVAATVQTAVPIALEAMTMVIRRVG